MNKIWLILLLTILTLRLNGQFFQYGQDPASIDWKYTESEYFKIIHPSGFDEKAKLVLSILDHYYLLNSAQLDHKPSRIPVVLHSHSVRSNGFVMWAPRRMEFFMYPDVHAISQDWYSHLALHEFRHVLQVDKLDKGFTNFLTLLLGQQGIGPAAGQLSFWLLEGDAIYAETSLSESGRGRSPEFEMLIKSHLLSDDKPWSYSKSYLGSYKDKVASYYHYGYQMVSFGQKEYGDDLWSHAIDYVGKRPYLIDPLWFYLKRETGGTKVDLYDNTMSYLSEHWRKESLDRRIIDPDPVNDTTHRFHTSYKSPRLLPDSSVVAVKTGFQFVNRIVRILPDGEEKTLHIPGNLNSERISYRKNRIVWDEVIPSLRWSNLSYSDLRIYDMDTDRVKRISYQKRYSAPSFSHSGDSIVAVETTLNNDFFLVFLNTEGELQARIPSPEKYMQLLDPAWIENSDMVAVVGLNESGKQLLTYDMKSGIWDVLFDSRYYDISSPVSAGNYVLFRGSFTGLDEIYAIRLSDREMYKLSHSRFGAFQPDALQEDMYSYAFYENEGFNVTIRNFSDDLGRRFRIPDTITEQPFFSYGDSVFIPEPVMPKVDAKEYNKGNFSRLGDLFRLHSWAPYWFDYLDPQLGDIELGFPGLTLLSQNLLGTAVSYAGYEYKEDDHWFHAGITYSGFTPVIDFSVSSGGKSLVNAMGNDPQPEPVRNLRYNIRSYIPLVLNRGRWISGIRPSLQLSYSRDYFFYTGSDMYQSGMLYLEPGLFGYIYQRAAYLDIIPRWGTIVELKGISAPLEDEQLGNAWSLKSTVFLPGLVRNHGIRLRAEIQRQNPDRYLYNNLIAFPRGYNPIVANDLNRFSADYLLPLLYPDVDFFGLFYLKRIRAELFADYIQGNNIYFPVENGIEPREASFLSYGMKLDFDYHPFRTLLPVSTGVRLSYLDSFDDFSLGLSFSVNLGF